MAELHPEQFSEGPPASNGLGLASFIVAIVGLCSGGCLSFIGFVMGLIALRNEPKGFAIAGIIIGFIGTFGGLILAASIFGFFGAFGLGIATIFFSEINIGIQQANHAAEVVHRWQIEHGGTLPTPEQAKQALAAAGFDVSYTLLSPDEFEIQFVLDPENQRAWSFTGTYDSDGERTEFHWSTD